MCVVVVFFVVVVVCVCVCGGGGKADTSLFGMCMAICASQRA